MTKFKPPSTQTPEQVGCRGGSIVQVAAGTDTFLP